MPFLLPFYENRLLKKMLIFTMRSLNSGIIWGHQSSMEAHGLPAKNASFQKIPTPIKIYKFFEMDSELHQQPPHGESSIKT